MGEPKNKQEEGPPDLSDWLEKVLKGEKRPTKRMSATLTDTATPVVKSFILELILSIFICLAVLGLLVWAFVSMRW
jgi:hypothetical protein